MPHTMRNVVSSCSRFGFDWRHLGVSQNEAAGTGSLSQGSVSRVCFVVCFGGLFRTVLLPRTVKFKGSVSGYVSGVCFAKVELPSLT